MRKHELEQNLTQLGKMQQSLKEEIVLLQGKMDMLALALKPLQVALEGIAMAQDALAAQRDKGEPIIAQGQHNDAIQVARACLLAHSPLLAYEFPIVAAELLVGDCPEAAREGVLDLIGDEDFLDSLLRTTPPILQRTKGYYSIWREQVEHSAPWEGSDKPSESQAVSCVG